MAERVAGMAEQVAWRQLFHVYCQRIDQGLPADLGRLFAPEARLILAFAGRRTLSGRAEIEAWFAEYMAQTRRESWPNRHWVGGVALRGDGRVARGRNVVDALGVARASGVMTSYRGGYRDELICEGGHWFFRERTIALWDQCAGRGAVQRWRSREQVAAPWLGVWSYEESRARYFADPEPTLSFMNTKNPTAQAEEATVKSRENFSPLVSLDPDWLQGEGVPAFSATEAEEMIKVEQVMNRCLQALSEGGQAEALAGVLAPEAQIRMDPAPEAVAVAGPEQVGVWHAAWQAAGRPGRRQVLVPVVVVRGERAQVLAYLTEVTPTGRNVHYTQGRWQLRLRRHPRGEWLITDLEELRFFSHDEAKGGAA